MSRRVWLNTTPQATTLGLCTWMSTLVANTAPEGCGQGSEMTHVVKPPRELVNGLLMSNKILLINVPVKQF